MADRRLREAIAKEAARLMYERSEKEYFTAKRKAAKRLCRKGVKLRDLPSNAEIRDYIESYAKLYEGPRRDVRLKDMRIEALRLMRLLQPFRPRLIGSVLTGHIRRGSDIDLHVFCDNPGSVADFLRSEGLQVELEAKRVRKHGEDRVYYHIHIFGRFQAELTVYPEDKAHYVFRSSITGRPMERATLPELEALLRREYPGIDLDAELSREQKTDPFLYYRMLLLPLENVTQNPVHHPEGDVLYHSLQVFELAKDHLAYDEEFLTAALLHDVGKGIDPGNHVQAALSALEGLITERTAFFIGHHMEAHLYRAGKLDRPAAQRLERSPDFHELLLLSELDDAGRVPGAIVGTVDEALDYLRELEQFNEG